MCWASSAASFFSGQASTNRIIVQEVFDFVKRNLSGAKRRKDAASGERDAGKGARPFAPPKHTETRSARSAPKQQFLREPTLVGMLLSE